MKNPGQDSSAVSGRGHATTQTTTTTTTTTTKSFLQASSMTVCEEIVKEWYPHVRSLTYFVCPRTLHTTKTEGEPSDGGTVFSLSVPEKHRSHREIPNITDWTSSLCTTVRLADNDVDSVHVEPFHRQESENRPVFIGSDHPETPTVLQPDITDQNDVYSSNADVAVLCQSRTTIPGIDSSSLFNGNVDNSCETLADRAQEMTVTEAPEGSSSKVQESDIRDDFTQRLVLRCLQKTRSLQKEVMFVISQLNFRNYLNNPDFQEAVSSLPKPRDLKSENKHRGDFDILILHRTRGIIACEIKSVGNNFSSLSLSQPEQDLKVAKRIRQCIKQLDKEEDVLSHVTSDLPSTPKVTKTPMLPHISREQLKRILQSSQELRRELCLCLGLNEAADPSGVCLTSDDMQDATNWWSELMNMAGVDDAMTEDVYLQLVSRFAGPATLLSSSDSGEQEPTQTDDGLSTKQALQDSQTGLKPVSPPGGIKKSRKKLKKDVVNVPTSHSVESKDHSVIPHRGLRHWGTSPADCEQCGKDLALVLLNKVQNVQNVAWGNHYQVSHHSSLPTAVLRHAQFLPYSTNIIVTLSNIPAPGGWTSCHHQPLPSAGIIRGLYEMCATFPRLTVIVPNATRACLYCNPAFHNLSRQCPQIHIVVENVHTQRLQAEVLIHEHHTEVRWKGWHH